MLLEGTKAVPVTIPLEVTAAAFHIPVTIDPLLGLNCSLEEETLRGRFPVFVVTHTKSIEAFVDVSSVIAELVELVAVPAVAALRLVT